MVRNYLERVEKQSLRSHLIALVALEAGCLQRPNSTELLGLSDSVFTTTSVVAIVDPSTLKQTETSPTTLSTAAIAGIAIGGGVLLLLIVALVVIRCRRRRNRTGGLGRKPRWDRGHKRRSSFSFKCRNILASPLSPKFFRDLASPVQEEHQDHQDHQGQQQSYGSLDAQMAGIPAATNGGPGTGAQGRYYIESKPKLSRHPYETSLDGWRTQDVISAPPPEQTTSVVPDRWNTYSFPADKKKGMSRNAPITIDTTEAALARPPAAHQSPRANQFGISPTAHKTSPVVSASHYYNPADTTPVTTISPSQTSLSGRSPNRPLKTTTTTMSSQGSGYPSLNGAPQAGGSSPSPLLRQQQHGWPGARESPAEPWFPPPPATTTNGRPPSTSTRLARKVSPVNTRRGKRESGSPVESRSIQVSFPAPPQR